ncbi:hypothetical protein [Rhizobium indigoferae]|uniref:Uncharacterized protein n=1 Tax=Rhizobium indigoferae TaxID=158891 RepID=A0ABZ1DNE2_9HYPH|nr:hypothetical protein [Rhizobium indigoferae]WRW37738.1 hypothetical protein U5G49_007364 [Rhizobium indigoferae]GLR60407.1 hypothetical protein GCM10007919_51360 [Rhizobium indigoferae]
MASAASFNIHRIHYDKSKFTRVDDLTSEIRKLVAAKLDDLEV